MIVIHSGKHKTPRCGSLGDANKERKVETKVKFRMSSFFLPVKSLHEVSIESLLCSVSKPPRTL